jgi:hypothetical protein
MQAGPSKSWFLSRADFASSALQYHYWLWLVGGRLCYVQIQAKKIRQLKVEDFIDNRTVIK